MARIDLHNFFKHYDENNPKHVAAVEQLEVDLGDSPLMEDGSNWVRIFRSQPEKPRSSVLDVPFYPQTDNYRDANRTCNSSACAMVLEYFKPGTLKGPKGDDAYVQKVFSILMALSQVSAIPLLLLTLIVNLPLADLLLLVFFIAGLYLVPQAGTW